MFSGTDNSGGEQRVDARASLWVRLAWLASAGAVVLVVALAFLQFHVPGHGFTYVFDFGQTLGLPRLPEIDATPTYIHPGVPGYDGQMYAQLALRPAADDPELLRVLDNPPYRARRVFMGWVSWVVGLGRPWWVLNAHACMNLVAWLALSVLTLRWFPPSGGLQSFVRWTGVMLSAGMLSSLRHAVTDGPALFAIAGTMALVEGGWRWAAAITGAAAGLTRETSLLLGAAFLPQAWRDRRGWLRAAVDGLVMTLPLLLWIWHLRALASSTAFHNGGFANFTWPFAGFLERWMFLLQTLFDHGWQKTAGASLLLHLALTVNMAWIIARPRWKDRWWRIGAVHVLLLAGLNTQVWEGFPGASARALLPLVLAFNILAPRGRAGLIMVLAGNLSIFAGMLEMGGPPRQVWSVEGPAAFAGGGGHRGAVNVGMGAGFHRLEGRGSNTWQWTSGDAVARIANTSGSTVRAHLRLELRARTTRAASVRVAGTEIWKGIVSLEHQEIETAAFDVPPGGVDVELFVGRGDSSPVGEERALGLRVFAFDVVIE